MRKRGARENHNSSQGGIQYTHTGGEGVVVTRIIDEAQQIFALAEDSHSSIRARKCAFGRELFLLEVFNGRRRL